MISPPLVPKLRREQLLPGDVLCNHCSAKCCKYFALAVETPTDARDWEFVRWYLMHDASSLFKEDDTWYLLVHTTCKHLLSDNRCGVYHTRPMICREYSTKDCEYEDEWLYEQYLETSEQVVEYAEAVLPKKRGQSIRSAKPPLLPVLTA
ncbi:MAG: YkgJ family cysteine cluster protein [Pirellulales bacterium]